MLLLLLLPSLALASINVSMKGLVYYENDKFNIIGTGTQKGFDQQVVVSDDLTTLYISKDQLKSMIEKVHGKKPDHVLVRSDETWGDIYGKQNWKQVQRRIEPNVDEYYLDFKQEKVSLSSTKYENPNNKRKSFQVTESKTVNNYVMSIWTRPMVKGKNVNVKFDFEVEDDYEADFQKDFAIGDDRRFVVHEKFSQNRTIDILPKQSVTARLEATKGTITAVIPFNIKLSGDVVGKYNTMYKDKYFFKFDIKQLLEANQRSATITVYQTVLFEFHYDVKLHIVGADEIVLKTFSAEHSIDKDGGKRKAEAKKEFESAEGVKLLKKSIPAEFIERLHKAVVEETVDVNEESSETA